MNIQRLKSFLNNGSAWSKWTRIRLTSTLKCSQCCTAHRSMPPSICRFQDILGDIYMGAHIGRSNEVRQSHSNSHPHQDEEGRHRGILGSTSRNEKSGTVLTSSCDVLCNIDLSGVEKPKRRGERNYSHNKSKTTS